MNNKEFREDQLLRAGWTRKSPGSGYWHRPNVSFYFDANEAYEQECRFPEQVRAMFISQGVKDFGKRELNNDSMNAAIADNYFRQLRAKLAKPLVEFTHIEHKDNGTHVITHNIAPKRFKTCGNGIYHFIVDNETGASIFHLRGHSDYVVDTKVREIIEDECKRMNSAQKRLVYFGTPIASRPLSNMEQTAQKYIDADIDALNKVRDALGDSEKLKDILTQPGIRMKNIRGFSVPSGLLDDLGIRYED